MNNFQSDNILQDLSKNAPYPVIPSCDGYHIVYGDSMYPMLKSGDVVFYKRMNSKENIVWGEKYLTLVEHEGQQIFLQSYIRKAAREGYAQFAGANDNTTPVEFPIKSIVELAHIKASVRVESMV